MQGHIKGIDPKTICRQLLPELVVMATMLFAFSSRAEIIRGPYLSFVNDPDHSMVVSWGTDVPAIGAVAYGIDTTYSNVVMEEEPDTVHHVELAGLVGSTHYFYRVSCDSDTAVGDFWTAPGDSQDFVMVAYGDSRSNPVIHGMVVSLYMQYLPRLIVNSGDLAYHGEIWEFDAYLFAPAADAMAHSPFISCVGGHDADPWCTPPYFTFDHYRLLMAYPGNELYFSFDYGPIHFTVLNSEVAWQYGPETPQTQWLMADMAAMEQPYRIVMFHMPPYTSGSGNPNNMLIRQHWCPIFRQHHVQMVINGHQHFYQRCEPGDGIVYVITGGGGAGLYYPDYDSSYVVSAHRAHHFLWLQVQPDSITVTAIDTSDSVLDQFVIFPWSPVVPASIHDLVIQRDTTAAHLMWSAIQQDTLGNPIMVEEYRIYRDPVTPDFLPDSTNLVGITEDTCWTDTTVSLGTVHAFYRATAFTGDD
jgi:hypothetical protein